MGGKQLCTNLVWLESLSKSFAKNCNTWCLIYKFDHFEFDDIKKKSFKTDWKSDKKPTKRKNWRNKFATK